MTAKNRQLGLGAFVLALLAPPLNLWAQEAQTASEDEDAMNISCGIVRGNVVCEEILVTATRRTANVQDVAVAVTAVTGEDLRALGINDLFRLDAITPGLQVGLSGADPRPAMRGARTQQVEANDVAISFYTDGIYRPRHAQALAGFVDVDRVEVLRGPQGTLFGRNSLGGLVHVISNRPNAEEADYGVSLTTGDYSWTRGEGFVNLPLGDSAALRVAAVQDTRDPYVQNTTIGDRGGMKDADTTYVRAQLAFAPSDRFDVNLRLEQWNDDSNGNGHFGYYVEGVPVNLRTGLTNGVTGVMRPRIGRSDECTRTCGRAGAGFDMVATPGLDTAEPVTGSPYLIADDAVPSRALEETTYAVELNFGLDFADLKLNIANMDYGEYRWADCDLTRFAYTECGNDITSETGMQEIQLTSATDGRLEWVMGAFFLQEDLQNAFLWRDIASLADGNLPVSPPDRNTFASWANQIRVDTSSTAFYAEAKYAVNESWRVIGGVRYTDDERDWQIYGQNPDNVQRLDFSVLEVPDGEGGWSKVTWRAGLEADVTEQSLLYFTVSTGFLAGNQQGAFQGTNSYDEQLVTAFELGSKNSSADGRVIVNASFYYNRFEDLLATRFVDTGVTTLAFTDNAGEINALGLELEIDWLTTEQLSLGARVALQNVEYGEFALPNVYQEGGTTVSGVANVFDLEGLQVQNSPDLTLSVLASYLIDLGSSGSLLPSIALFYSSDYRADDSPWFYGNQAAYTKTDLSITWRSLSGDWSLRAFINNLEDEAVLKKATRFGGDVAITDYGTPRQWGLALGYRY